MIHKKLKVYDHRDDVTLTTYIMEAKDNLFKDQKRPAVLILGGGSYLYVSERETFPVAQRFNAMGYQTFILNYSTYYETKADVEDPSLKPGLKEESVFPGPMQDVAKAMDIIVENSEEWWVNPDQIGILGFSAGGHLAASYGTQSQNPAFHTYSQNDPADLRPRFLLLAYPVIDFSKYLQVLAFIDNEEIIGRLKEVALAIFGTEEPSQETLQAYNPALHVDSETPATFIWTTGEDRVVSPTDSTDFALAMQKAGRPVEYHLFNHGPHGMSLADRTSSTHPSQQSAHVAQWVNLADQWLADLLADD